MELVCTSAASWPYLGEMGDKTEPVTLFSTSKALGTDESGVGHDACGAHLVTRSLKRPKPAGLFWPMTSSPSSSHLSATLSAHSGPLDWLGKHATQAGNKPVADKCGAYALHP